MKKYLASLALITLWILVGLVAVVAVTGTVVLLAVVALVAGLTIGVVEVTKSVPRIPNEYRKLRPVKAWDGFWAVIAIRKLHPMVRLGLISAALSLAVAIIRVAEVSQYSRDFAWGLLIATALLAGIESCIRHREVEFKYEVLGILLECIFAAAVFFGALHSAWFKGAAAACLLEIAGFIIFCAIAASRDDPGLPLGAE